MAEKKNQVAAQGATDTNTRYRLKKRYVSEIVPALMSEKGYKNVNEVPKVVKITLNMRLGDIKDNAKSIQLAQGELEAIAGQKSIVTKAKKSVANFKLRENQPIGIKVTLRGDKMYEFLDKLVSIALPRVRDFRGISGKSFDGRGNYSMGIKEQIIFPEIAYEQVEKVRGFDICIVTTAKSDDEAKALLTKIGMPFRN
ncbi:MAG: 50S ribosomal protein L5 [Clostridiales bacterium]|nr:50S ribosomal protein L5 [Clostridiales bacterium]